MAASVSFNSVDTSGSTLYVDIYYSWSGTTYNQEGSAYVELFVNGSSAGKKYVMLASGGGSGVVSFTASYSSSSGANLTATFHATDNTIVSKNYTVSGSGGGSSGGGSTTSTYTLSISQGTGTTIYVWRGNYSERLYNGATIYHGESLYIYCLLSDGYSNLVFTKNGTYGDDEGFTTVVDSNIYLSSSATAVSGGGDGGDSGGGSGGGDSSSSGNTGNPVHPEVGAYRLWINKGAHTSIKVVRTGSSEAWAECDIELYDGDWIYYHDVIIVTYGVDVGYNLSLTVPGMGSSGDIWVTGDVAITSSASVKQYTLSLEQGAGSVITVNRTSSPLKGAATGTIPNGSTIYYNDVLKISFSTSGIEYEIVTHTVNGSVFASGNSHTVTNNVVIVSTAKLIGVVYIYNGTSYDKYLIYIHNGSTWEQYIPYVYDGSNWIICS